MAVNYGGIDFFHVRTKNSEVHEEVNVMQHDLEAVSDKMDVGRVANYVPTKIKPQHCELIVPPKEVVQVSVPVRMAKDALDNLVTI